MLSHVSASSIKLFNNCNRRWYDRYVLGRKGETSKAMERGSAVHKQLEDYLQSGEFPDTSDEGQIAKSGLKYLPPPSEDLHVEITLEDYPIEGTPAPFKGFIDLYVTPEQADDGIPEILDHKTTSNFKYALTAKDLSEDIQMIIYAAHMLHHLPDATHIRLTHVCYLTKPPYQSQHTSTVVSREHVDSRFSEILEIVEKMVAASELPATAMDKNKGYCFAYGKRCPAYDACQRTLNHAGVKHMSDKQLSVLDKLRGTSAPKTTEKKATAPKTAAKKAAPAAEAPVTSGCIIFVNCASMKGALTPLAQGLKPLIDKVCANKGVTDIDLVQYKAGHALLSSLIREEGLPEGEYVVAMSSDLWAKCSDALIEKADQVIVGI